MTPWRVRALLLGDTRWVARILAAHPLWAEYGLSDIERARDHVHHLLARGEEGLALLRKNADAEGLGESGRGQGAPGAQRPVGFAIYTVGTFGDGGYLRLIGVSPGETGGGAGSALLSALEGRLARRGVDRLFLLCNERNAAAQRFYERSGYRQVGELLDWAAPGVHERMYLKRGLTAADACAGRTDGGGGPRRW